MHKKTISILSSIGLTLFLLTGCVSIQAPASPSTTASTPSATAAPSAVKELSEADAKAKALERVPGATEADITSFKLDDHRYYEGEIRYNKVEYDFEIDRTTGEFTEWEEDHH